MCSGAYSKEWIYMHISRRMIKLKHEVCAQQICGKESITCFAAEQKKITVNPGVSHEDNKSLNSQ